MRELFKILLEAWKVWRIAKLTDNLFKLKQEVMELNALIEHLEFQKEYLIKKNDQVLKELEKPNFSNKKRKSKKFFIKNGKRYIRNLDKVLKKVLKEKHKNVKRISIYTIKLYTVKGACNERTEKFSGIK
jgi:predicted RNase H-like nuclease (RuvC/YqgF family)